MGRVRIAKSALLTNIVILLTAIALSLELAEAYDQTYYQGTYYGQGTYYSQSTYYSEGSYNTLTFRGDVKFEGGLTVGGALSKGAGTFVIDHPLDPENMFLYHSFVESPDVKNIYDGMVTMDTTGEAVVELPDYFETLNKDYRYQVKGVDVAQPAVYVKTEVQNNQFTIAGGAPGALVSWQVTGTRKDPYIMKFPIINVVEKGGDALVGKGDYLFSDYELWAE